MKRDRFVYYGILVGALVAALLLASWLVGCEAQQPNRERERTAELVHQVEEYSAGRLTADELLRYVLNMYNESLRDRPTDGGNGIWELVGVALATAIPATAGGITLLNRRRDVSRQAELADRDAALDNIRGAIAQLQAKT